MLLCLESCSFRFYLFEILVFRIANGKIQTYGKQEEKGRGVFA